MSICGSSASTRKAGRTKASCACVVAWRLRWLTTVARVKRHQINPLKRVLPLGPLKSSIHYTADRSVRHGCKKEVEAHCGCTNYLRRVDDTPLTYKSKKRTRVPVDHSAQLAASVCDTSRSLYIQHDGRGSGKPGMRRHDAVGLHHCVGLDCHGTVLLFQSCVRAHALLDLRSTNSLQTTLLLSCNAPSSTPTLL